MKKGSVLSLPHSQEGRTFLCAHPRNRRARSQTPRGAGEVHRCTHFGINMLPVYSRVARKYLSGVRRVFDLSVSAKGVFFTRNRCGNSFSSAE